MSDDLDPDALAVAIEDFNRFYLRLPVTEPLSVTTLSVLDTLAASPRPLRLTELTRTELVTQPAVTQLVTRLERDGLVRRVPDPSDGRAVLVQITDAGRAVGETRRRDRLRGLVPLLADLDPEQREALAAAIPALSRLAELGQDQRRAGWTW